MSERVELLVRRDGDKVVLAAPEVGTFTCALESGQLVAPGARAGMLQTLGRTFELVVPRGVTGRIVSERPARIHEPVDYGRRLYELAPIETEEGGAVSVGGDTEQEEDGSIFRSPHVGRFWHRPTPDDPPFVSAGDVIEAGETVGLIEVMKTFAHLAYTPGETLPAKARVVAVRAADGAEVAEGDVLLEVEPAP